jgi:DNA-binding MarR family transcriptional regulator
MKSQKPGSTRDFAGEIRRLLDLIAKNNQVYEDSCVAFFGVTTSQGGTLLSLPVEGTLRMNELSNSVGVDNSTMTRMVDQLVEKDLVFRKADENDRRLVRVGLTRSGTILRDELSNALANFYKDSLDGIEEKERASIIRSLEVLNSAIGRGLENCCKKYCNPQNTEAGNIKK